MSCLMFDSELCSNLALENELLCNKHKCKKILSDTCNICLGEMKTFVFVLCGHSFHKECISEWLSKQQTCPCCRVSLKSKDIQEELNNTEQQINDYNNIIITNEFIEWFFEMARIYIDMSNICLLDMLFVVQTNRSNLIYFMNTFNNDIRNISIDVFELELKLNYIANFVRNVNENEDENDEDENYDNF